MTHCTKNTQVELVADAPAWPLSGPRRQECRRSLGVVRAPNPILAAQHGGLFGHDRLGRLSQGIRRFGMIEANRMKRTATAVLGLWIGHVGGALLPAADAPRWQVAESLDIAEVPAGFPVRFSLLTQGQRQYVGYFDKERRMTVASRRLDSSDWQRQALPSRIGWDSHNYITLAVDRDGRLHVSGNMHCVPLNYFRTAVPGNISTLTQHAMTGAEETRVTYPHFLADREGELIFHYRSGRSGNGKRIFNRYDRATRTWSRLLEKPLLDGENARNAYPLGPIQGADGWFHVVWVWRDTPDCATNHHLSHARSRDMVHWESLFGDKVDLPMTLDKKSLWVDAVPSGGGIINGCEKLAFDSENRPLISYHKSDTAGNMQVWVARPEAGKWTSHALTDWKTPIKFGGGGSMGFIGIHISGLTPVEPGVLTLSYRHRDLGGGRLFIDEKSLRPLDRKTSLRREYPAELDRVNSGFKGMSVRRALDLGDSGDENTRYILQWETLGANNDRPRQPPLPEPGMLRVIRLNAVD